MNLFVLDSDPRLAAQAHYDKHVGKMLLEAAQMLSTAWWEHIDSIPAGMAAHLYLPAYESHPCTKWVQRTYENYLWAAQLAVHLGQEYRHRFGKSHASEQLVCGYLYPARPPLPRWERTVFEPCVTGADVGQRDLIYEGVTYPRSDEGIVQAYRHYYRHRKAHLHSYTNRAEPLWLAEPESAPVADGETQREG